MEPATVDPRITQERRGGEGALPVGGPATLEVPPGEGGGVRGLVGLEGRELRRLERAVVDAGVLDGAGEEAALGRGVEVAEAQEDEAVVAEGLGAARGVAGVGVASSVERDLSAVVDDGDLDEGVAVGGLERVVRLLPLRSTEDVAAGHPLAGRKLTQDDGVEDPARLLDGQDAAAALGQVGGGDPRDERLVAERNRRLFGTRQGGARQGGEGRDRPQGQPGKRARSWGRRGTGECRGEGSKVAWARGHRWRSWLTIGGSSWFRTGQGGLQTP